MGAQRRGSLGGPSPPPPEFFCPISHCLMMEPVKILNTGVTINRTSAQAWMRTREPTLPDWPTMQRLQDAATVPLMKAQLARASTWWWHEWDERERVKLTAKACTLTAGTYARRLAGVPSDRAATARVGGHGEQRRPARAYRAVG